MRTKRFFGFLAIALWAAVPAWADCEGAVSVCSHETPGAFALIRGGHPAAVLIDRDADPAIRHAADSFAGDLQRVSGAPARVLHDPRRARGPVVVIGTAGGSALLGRLIRTGKIPVSDIAGQWEAFRQIVVSNPWPGVPAALIVVGADRRGGVFGAYDLSEKIGVSPWYWFADVPVEKRRDVFLTAGARDDRPAVKYRGFFINDEAPAFSTWAQKRFGGSNAGMYAHVFELLLRLKGNFLWPAMWSPRAFAADDPQNMKLADAMGVVMGTSHHEPMMRAYEEWHRPADAWMHGAQTGGPWNYRVNAGNLRAFWRGGIARMMHCGGHPCESVVTVGMRGDGDEPMAEDAASALESVVAGQRSIIAAVTGKPAAETPQVWALYKEVQDYYDRGMTVPDDVTLLFADDNWGQNRRLPDRDLARKGGYGVYYHFDYVGAPRNYKWIDTNQIEKVWQQMDLAYARGADRLWIVNVGDIKPMEFPLTFFLRQAWNPAAMTPQALADFPAQWAGAAFGPAQGGAIGDLLTRSRQLTARRKPELIDAESFALGPATAETLDGGEFAAMTAQWNRLETDMLAVKAKLPAAQRDAYFQLVEYPVAAMANLYRLYYAVAWNRKLAASNDARANVFADLAQSAFRRDGALTAQYHALNGGKWDGMMSQTHIGYTSWQQPAAQVMPKVARVAGTAGPIRFVDGAADALAVALEAPHFSRAVDGAGLHWAVIPYLGRTLGAVVALPQGRAPTAEGDGVRLEYDVTLPRSGRAMATLYLVPTLDVAGGEGVRIGVSLDGGPVQTVRESLTPAPNAATSPAQKAWVQAVSDNAAVLTVPLGDAAAGRHTIKIWRLDDNAVLQKLAVTIGDAPAAYLGPAEPRQ